MSVGRVNILSAIVVLALSCGNSGDSDASGGAGRESQYRVPAEVQRLARRPGLYRGPMLARVTGRTVTIAFQTKRAVRAAVEYRRTVSGSQGSSATANETLITTAPARKRHEVLLTRLKPGAEYQYRVRLGTRVATPWLPFRTAPGGPAPVRFALFGDSGTGHPAQAHVAGALARVRWDLVVHSGDLIYNLGEEHHYTARFFQVHRAMLAMTPFYGSLGNHDYGTQRGAPYLRNLVLPNNNSGGHERWYSFRYGSGRFICLDSNLFGPRFAQSPQGRWLSQQLKEKFHGWTFVFFHHQLLSGVGKRLYWRRELRRRKYLAPSLEVPGVDLILVGHLHSYQRSHPTSLTGKRKLVHVISGGGGGLLYPVQSRKYLAFASGTYHYVRFDVLNARELELSAVEVLSQSSQPTDFSTRILDRIRLRRSPAGVVTQ